MRRAELPLARGRGELRRGLEAAERVRLLEDRDRRTPRGVAEPLRVGRAPVVRHLDDLHPEARRVGLHDLPHHRVERLREHDALATRMGARDEACVGRDRGPVVARRVRDVHSRQLADRGLVLEDRLEHALAHLGLIRRVRGEELTAAEEGVDDRRHVVVVDPHAQEAELVGRVRVPPRELLEMSHERGLGQRLGHVERPVEAEPLRDLLEQLVDRGDADRREHRFPVGLGEREVAGSAHCSATCAVYASTSRRPPISPGSATRIRTSQPSP